MSVLHVKWGEAGTVVPIAASSQALAGIGAQKLIDLRAAAEEIAGPNVIIDWGSDDFEFPEPAGQ